MSKRMLAAVAATLLFAVPRASAATLDLFTNGTTMGTISLDSSGGMTIFSRTDQQPTGTGFIDPFVRLDATGSGTRSPEQGYNTDFRPVQFDEKQDAQYTHSLLFSDLGTVTIGGVDYYKFLLDANQTGSNPGISLDQLVISQGDTALNTGFDTTTNQYVGPTTQHIAYTLDVTSSNNEVALAVQNTNGFNANNGSGSGDLYVYVKTSAFDRTLPYVYLYSHFGNDTSFTSTDPPGTFDLSNNDGFEEWAAFTGQQFVPPVPEPSTIALTLSGFVSLGFAGLRRFRRVVA